MSLILPIHGQKMFSTSFSEQIYLLFDVGQLDNLSIEKLTPTALTMVFFYHKLEEVLMHQRNIIVGEVLLIEEPTYFLLFECLYNIL